MIAHFFLISSIKKVEYIWISRLYDCNFADERLQNNGIKILTLIYYIISVLKDSQSETVFFYVTTYKSQTLFDRPSGYLNQWQRTLVRCVKIMQDPSPSRNLLLDHAHICVICQNRRGTICFLLLCYLCYSHTCTLPA